MVNTSLVTGKIILGKEIRSFTGAVVHVYLEDVTYLDAPAKIIAKQTLSGVSHEVGTEDHLTFVLYGEIPDDRANYAVRVHVDFHGDEEIHLGDYISTESYSVLTYCYPNHVLVNIHEVK